MATTDAPGRPGSPSLGANFQNWISGPPLNAHYRRVNMRVGKLPLPVGLVSPTFLLRMHPMRDS